MTLRASLLALVALGIVIKPMMASDFELHSVDHELAVQAHGHDHQASSAHDIDPSAPAGDVGQDHVQGSHGLLHESKCGGAYSDSVVALSLPLAPHLATVVATPAASPVALQHIPGPFRPPIA